MAVGEHHTRPLGIGVQLGLHEGAGPRLGQPAGQIFGPWPSSLMASKPSMPCS
jgi:hypothetical protein